ncbi:MAG: hypothetical protein VW455_05420 [Nitrospinota bacterium]
MEKKLTITAISGWAVPESWYAEQIQTAFPDSDINIVYPKQPEDSREAKEILDRFQSQLYIGYSLGSLWLLKYQSYLPKNCLKALLAPILAFLNNADLGGKTSKSQLEYLIKILARNSNQTEVLRDFFFHANLPYPETHMQEIKDKNILINGLEFLKNSSVSGKETNDFLSIIGENDIFVDAEALKRHIPHLEIIRDVGHSPIPLLNQLAKTLKKKETI